MFFQFCCVPFKIPRHSDVANDGVKSCLGGVNEERETAGGSQPRGDHEAAQCSREFVVMNTHIHAHYTGLRLDYTLGKIDKR